MDEKYWDNVAADYDGEIFSALANDRNDVIASKICEFGRKEEIACDFGCGVGKFLPVLSKKFWRVYAVDISNELLNQARENCKTLRNITYFKKDLSQNRSKLERIDFALSVNVLITASAKMRSGIVQTICKHLRKAGHLLLVVPSLESALYADFRLVQWNLKAGWSAAEAVSEIEDAEDADTSLRQGVVEIDGVPTKHYLQEELLAMFKKGPFEVLSIEKVEYPWATEFDGPPGWMKEPYPWDWMAVLRKVKN